MDLLIQLPLQSFSGEKMLGKLPIVTEETHEETY